jgi:hypothetical protein
MMMNSTKKQTTRKMNRHLIGSLLTSLALTITVGQVASFTTTTRFKRTNKFGIQRSTSRLDAIRSDDLAGKTKETISPPRKKSMAKLPSITEVQRSLHAGALFGVGGSLMPLAAAAGEGMVWDTALNTLSTAVVDPSLQLEAELLTDLSHVGLDLASVFLPGGLKVRTAAFLGRLAAMAADYVPDAHMQPEEWVFQGFMLTLAWIGLVKAVVPAVYAQFSKVGVKDGKAFSALFEPAGMTWPQFKTMSAVGAIDWVNASAGETIQAEGGDDYMYWLYSGSVDVKTHEGGTVYSVARGQGGADWKNNAVYGLLGETRLLHSLTMIQSKSTPVTSIQAASNAKLLRIHTGHVKKLMDDDPKFATAVQALLFQGMEAKLTAQVLAATAATNSTA